MSSKVEICNMALAAIRGKSINSLTEPSREAQQCNLHYDIARRFVLRDSPWQFAKKVVALQLRTEEPLHWIYAYQYPGDCLNLRTVTGDYAFKTPVDTFDRPRVHYNDYIEPELSQPYEIHNDGDNKIIVTDVPEAYAIYTKNVELTTLFDAQFITAFSFYLGSLIAVPISGVEIGSKMRSDSLSMYTSTMSAAVSAEMNEQRQPARREPALVRARR